MRHETSPLIIAGASRGVGFILAQQESAIGRPVMALVRPSSNDTQLRDAGIAIVPGDALSPDDATRLFEECRSDCDVVSTIGGVSADGRRADDEGNINFINAAVKAGIRGRFLLVTSIGCGDMAPFRSERAIAAFGAAVDAKTRAEDYLRVSGLSWTILRPGGLRSEPGTGRGVLSTDPALHGFISRFDVAQLAQRILRDPATIGRAFAAVDQDAAHSVNPLDPFPLQLS
ncbi:MULTISPECIES: SDR family oxidoreductase [Alphaproteobacteria]|uniref:SDR family oxidoreductase n=1 Tax=Alphaproteobacteria TaxID=28211 RepID=UPI0011BDF54E|nr:MULTISPECIES: SDR family oxidoreductase [Alphaproteobacteria]